MVNRKTAASAPAFVGAVYRLSLESYGRGFEGWLFVLSSRSN